MVAAAIVLSEATAISTGHAGLTAVAAAALVDPARAMSSAGESMAEMAHEAPVSTTIRI